MTNFWNFYISFIVIITIVGTGLLLHFTRNNPKGQKGEETPETIDHHIDGITELNNPLPKWWLNVFWLSIVFGVGYLFLYPGLGRYQGYLNWSSVSEWTADKNKAEEQFEPLYKKYLSIPVVELVKDKTALAIGKNLFEHNCSQCHGSDAKGGMGFPNLTDNDWLYGGTPQTIETTILYGRNGVMPVFTTALGGKHGVDAVAEYVQKISGRHVDEALASEGKTKFQAICSACHGMDGKGNQMIGAPNLTDNIWLYGGTEEIIKETIYNGRHGQMPAHKDTLGPARVHLLANYVYSLSHSSDK